MCKTIKQRVKFKAEPATIGCSVSLPFLSSRTWR